MSYYYKYESPKNEMGHVLLGAAFVDDDTHAKILSAKGQFIEIVNRCTIDCELSRKAGIEINRPKVHEASIGCHLIHRGEDVSLTELKASAYVTYWLNCLSAPDYFQVLSSHEINNCAKDVEDLFKSLLSSNSK